MKSLGLENGEKVEFTVFVKDANYTDHILEKLDAQINGDKAEVEWEFNVDEKMLGISERKEKLGRYSQPFFYFDVYSAGLTAKSPLLYYEDYVEIEVKDDEGKAVKDKEYKAIIPTGEIKQGKLDGSGKTKIEKIPPGKIKLTLKSK